MKKSDALVKAVMNRKPSIVDSARILSLKKGEIPEGVAAGQEVCVCVTGTIDSINANGDVSLKIAKVEPDEEDDSEKETEGPEVLRVQTQESHA